MEQVRTDPKLVAACGLYCAACRKYTAAKCQGCHSNSDSHWCKILACTRQKGIQSCAECSDVGIESCKIFNHPISRVFELLFRSDRKACINRIRLVGYDTFAGEMASSGKQVLKKS